MTIDRIRSLRDELRDIGALTVTISTTAQTTLGNEDDQHQSDDLVLFQQLIVEPEIKSVTADLFSSGHYNVAVAEAFKAVDNFVAKRVGEPKSSGTPMMESVFSPTKPKLYWTNRATKSEEDEQKGYHRIFAGAVLGIRNPTTHEFEWISDADQALELIVFAQLLFRKAKNAIRPPLNQ